MYPIRCNSKSDLISLLKREPVKIPKDRSGHARSQSELDWYCARKFLLTLAYNDRLTYPIEIEQGESPDFLVTWPDGSVSGLEITNVTSPDVEARLTNDSQQPWGSDGWLGKELERGLAKSALAAVKKKELKMSGGQWRKANRHDILLYNDGAFVFADRQESVLLLQRAFSDYNSEIYPCGGLGTISLLDSDHMVIYDLKGECRILRPPGCNGPETCPEQ